MDWRQAVGTVSQRRVKEEMGEALGHRQLETCPSSFPKLLPVADFGLDVALTWISQLGRPGLQCSLSVGEFLVCRLNHGRQRMSNEPEFTRTHSFSCPF